ncbi:MAG: cohesin domain-containing protein [bacterium]
MKNKHWTVFIPFLLGFSLLVSSSLFLGCSAKIHQGNTLPEVSGEKSKEKQAETNDTSASSPELTMNGLIINDRDCTAVGDEVTFTVLVHNAPNAVSAMGFEVIYDESILEYKGFVRGKLTQEFDMFDISHNQAGTLRIGGVMALGDVPQGSSDEVADLVFVIRQYKPATLKLANLADDVQGWPVHDGHLIAAGRDGSDNSQGAELREGGENLSTVVFKPQLEDDKPAAESKTSHHTLSISSDRHNHHTLSSDAPVNNDRSNLGSNQTRLYTSGSNQTRLSASDNTAKADRTLFSGIQATGNESSNSQESRVVFSTRNPSQGSGLYSNTSTPVQISTPGQYNNVREITIPSPDSKTGGSDARGTNSGALSQNDQSSVSSLLPGQVQGGSPGPGPWKLPMQPQDDPNIIVTPPPPTPEDAQKGSLSIDTQSCSGPGQEVIFPVILNNASNKVGSIAFTVGYDENILDYKSFSRGNLVQSFTLFDVSHQPGTNTLKVGGFDAVASSIDQGVSGTIVNLVFTTKKCETTILSLRNLADDLNGWVPRYGKLQAEVTTGQGTGSR